MKKRWIALLLVAVMAVSLLAGCNTAPGKETTAPTNKGTEPPATQGTEAPTTETPTVPYEDLPTLNVLFVHGYTYESDDNVVWREVAQRVGAKIHFIGADTDKFNTMLASGEGYDIVMTVSANMKGIAEGGSLVPLDDLLEEKLPNVVKNAPRVITYSKQNYSDDTGALYWLRYELDNGQRVAGTNDTAGMIRWDLYKEMGHPEVNSQEEFLQMLKDMNNKYPKTADGKTISGIAIPSDKLDLALYSPFYVWNGIQKGSGTSFFTWEDMTYMNRYDEDSIFWMAIEFYRAANKLGLLDPDSFAMTEADLKAKATEGRLLYITTSSHAGTMAEGQGFMALPRTWGKSYFSTASSDTAGVGGFPGGFAINKNTELLDECLKYLDLIHSEEGANLIYNGIEGVHYTVDENGVRSLTQEALDMYNATEGEEWEETGLGTAETSHFCALARTTIASDGKTVSLVQDASLFQAVLTPIQKDYSDYYGVDYPVLAQIQLKEKYNMGPGGYSSLVAAFLPKPTEDIKRIENSLKEYAESVAADLIYASDAEYAALAAKVQAEFESIGLSTVNEYYQDNWDTAYDKAAAYE